VAWRCLCCRGLTLLLLLAVAAPFGVSLALADRLPQEPAHWDNLLWYFAYQHKVVEQAHAQRTATRQQAAAKQAQAAGEPAQGPGQQLQPGDEELAPLVAPGAQQQSTAKRAKVDATP
jgi:hypothetical protein